MSVGQPVQFSRDQIEQVVRDVIRRRLSVPLANGPALPSPELVVNISARHCHLTQRSVTRLFGAGHTLTPMKPLYQEGEFAAEETVSVVGPRRRVLPSVRVLGPCRDYDQVELAFTDGISLGIDLPVRRSGDHSDTPGCYLLGPAGMVELTAGVIRAERHVHMNEEQAAYYGVKHEDRMDLHVHSACPTVLQNLLVRADPRYRLEVHLDTDEGNACDLERASRVELIRKR